MRAYVAKNFDGTSQAMVAADTLPEAAGKMRTSVYQLRLYGWRYADPWEIKMAIAESDFVFKRAIDHPDEWQRKERAAQ